MVQLRVCPYCMMYMSAALRRLLHGSTACLFYCMMHLSAALRQDGERRLLYGSSQLLARVSGRFTPESLASSHAPP